MTLRIAFVPGVTLTKWTRAWESRRPDVPLQFLPTPEADQVAVLHDRDADVGFVRLPIERDGLSVIRLYSEVPVVVLPREHPLKPLDAVSMAQLAGENLLVAVPPIKAVVELVAAGVGVVMLPHSVARLYGRKDVILRPVTDAPPTEIAIAWPANETTADVEEFVGIVRGRTARSSRATPPSTGKTAAARKSGARKAAEKDPASAGRSKKPRPAGSGARSTVRGRKQRGHR